MQFEIEQYISNLISSQFPQFYKEQGPNFILFMQAYYEWMESNTPLVNSSNTVITNSDGVNTTPPVYAARQLLNYRDIDNTLPLFLNHFQRKYLYGIPFNVIINKRFLLKHILDIYRSKGSINCYKLLFKLIYNEDVTIYLPSVDILKPSDGTWTVPRYLEVNHSSSLASLVGNEIIGLSSGVTAIVEGYVQEPINQYISNILYISNVNPPTLDFNVGETLALVENGVTIPFTNGPVILGSMGSFNVINGNYGISNGTILKVIEYVTNNGVTQTVSTGIDGLLKVTNTASLFGAISYNIINYGTGLTANASVFEYFPNLNGFGTTFALGPLINEEVVTYNTDLLCNYLTTTIGAATYGFPANSSGNSSSNIGILLTYTNSVFGSLGSIINANNGANYTTNPTIFIQSTIPSATMPGTVSYNTGSNTITGTGTNFTYVLTPNTMIVLIANSANTLTSENHIIYSVANDTSITLYDKPFQNSTSSAKYEVAPAIFPANFPTYNTIMYTQDGSIGGLNANVQATLTTGSGVVTNVQVLDSGRNYQSGQLLTAYVYNSVTQPNIINGGFNYTNGQPLIFVDSTVNNIANGYIVTNSNGTITGTVMNSYGSGYAKVPNVAIQSTNGYGAILTTTLSGINTAASFITGTVGESGSGKKRGYWTTTRSFLNSDKYIQDSYFYQAFSYQIKVSSVLNQYKEILYNTFHPAGSVMFGQYNFKDTISNPLMILQDVSVTTSNGLILYYTSDAINITSDTIMTVNTPEAYINTNTSILLTSDTTNMTSDSSNNTADAVNTN